MIKRFCIIFIFVFPLLHLHAQTELELRGDAEFKAGNFQAAWNYFNEAARTDTANIALWYKMGESAREFFNYNTAFQCYRIVYEKDLGKKFPQALFWMGDLSRNLSDYLMAKAYYSLYLEQENNSSFFEEKAEAQLNNFDKIEKLRSDTSSEVTVEHLSLPVNSPFSEFAGFQQGENKLYFTSVQPLLSENEDGLLGNSYLSSLYVSDFTTRGLSLPVKVTEPLNSSTKHTANICFNNDGSEVWFNRCEMSGEYKYRCDIYNAKLENGRWTFPEKISLNTEEYTSTQPYFYSDSTENEVLYFVSDRPGGVGQLDIWFSVRKEGKYNAPTNLGSIVNSPGNEITPFFDGESGKLYFSSDWYYGLGGYDVFYAKGSFSDWKAPENAGLPICSPANDFYFNINSVDRDGYFTSNREGSYFFKGETCCNDLYAYYGQKSAKKDTLPQPKDSVVVVNEIKKIMEDMLPLDLYFHNDIPDPRSRDTITYATYDETYYSYMAMIDRYKKEYSKGLSGDVAVNAAAEIEVFFLANVTAGFGKLLEITPLMIEDLEAGSRVTMKIQGFCSPLTGTEYNISLAKRRISSILNYFEKIDGGKIKPYLNGTASNGGQLIILAEPVGEALSDPFVSDNPNDTRNSVYSISAARERRIQIVSYESDFAGQKTRKLSGPLLTLSSNDLKLSLSDENQKCVQVTITNTGDEMLDIASIRSDQPWMQAKLGGNVIVPGNVTTLDICIDKTMLKNPALGVLIITSNSRDKQSVVYVRVK
ncbi:MAG: hypothetical protein A2W93_09225 [Bacteroidetes bacterium GWF2_43_63]|nr:MAG: hypothetical protein A2W94_05605 [Bacteroidetes bacterium GWE2_42_42]OFY54478.1 MAG: hypothetical protein A2W93_09225 [Bacteroidetes bacterium GWF2_43_63]HBG70426.1 hypothetical protein [Bacteroidales bacterium]HCB63457.1 hypothetical protein [Bacteroidales bacterium]